MVFVELVLGSSEGPAALQGLFQTSAGPGVADPFGEVGHVPKPDVGGERIGGLKIQRRRGR